MAKKKSEQPIVSSAHLISEESAELSEFEFALTIANNAFNRWIVHCMAAAEMKELASIDILVLHNVNHRKRKKRLADICFTLNIEDTHTVNYSLRKLVKLQLVAGEKQGKEIFYSTTESGTTLCTSYREVREHCLIEALSGANIDNKDIGELAKMMRMMSGLYDQAARAATSL